MTEIPDYDTFVEKAEQIQALAKKKNMLEYNIDKAEAKTVLRVVFEPEFAIGGKVPSMELIKLTYKVTGLDGEILPMREDLAIVSADLERARLEMELMRMQVDLFRTEAATNRMTTL